MNAVRAQRSFVNEGSESSARTAFTFVRVNALHAQCRRPCMRFDYRVLAYLLINLSCRIHTLSSGPLRNYANPNSVCGRGAGCRGTRRRGDTRGGTGKHPREATWTPDAKTCSGVQEMPPRPKAWYYSLLALRSGGGGRQLCTAGTPQPETKHAAHETHIVWLSSACRRRGTQESRWATALPHNRPSVRTMPAARSPSYAAQPTTCYTRGCCWASNALPRLLAICHGCSGGAWPGCEQEA